MHRAAWLLAMGLTLAVPASASASYNVTISTGATTGGAFSVSSGTATFIPTANDAVLNVGDLDQELAGANVVVGTGTSGSQAGNIVVSAGVCGTTTHALAFGPAAGGATQVNTTATPTTAQCAAHAGSIDISGPVSFSGATVLNVGTSFPLRASGQSYGGAVTLASASTLTTTAAGTVTFNGTVDSAGATGQALTVSLPAATTFAAAVGATHALSALTVAAATFSSSVTTTAGISAGATTLAGSLTMTVSTSGGLSLGTVNGGFGLTLNDGSGSVSTGAVGQITALSSLSVTGSATVAGSVTTTGNVSFNSPVSFSGPGSVGVLSANGTVSFGSTVGAGSGVSLTATAAGSYVYLVGDVNLPGSLTVVGGAHVNGQVTTAGTQTYTSQVYLTSVGNQTLSAGSTGVDFKGPVDATPNTTYSSAAALTVGGPATFESTVGAAGALKDLSTQAASLAGNVTTHGSQYYNGAVTLTTDAILRADADNTGNDASLEFFATVNGAHALTVANTQVALTFLGAVGGTTPLSSLAVTDGFEADVGADVTTTGDQSWGSANSGLVRLTGNATFIASAGNISLGDLFGTHAATLHPGSGKAVTMNNGNAANEAFPLTTLTVNGPLISPANAASLLKTSGDQTYNGPVKLENGLSATSTGGKVAFASTIDTDPAAGHHSLTVNGHTGVVFDAAVGAGTALSVLDTSQSASTELAVPTVTTTGDQDLSPLILDNDVTLTPPAALSVSAGSATLGSHTLTVNGGGTIAASEAGTGGLIKTGAGTLTLSGANSYSGPTAVNGGTLAGGTTGALSAGSALTLANAASAALSLGGFDQTVASLAGGGPAGGATALGAKTLTVGASNASTTYAGAITGSGTLRKLGLGTLTLTGTSAATTSVSAGTVEDDGGLGPVVLDGGTLAGTGSAGTVTQSADPGTLGPGVGSGTASLATGNLLLTTATTFDATLAGPDPGTGYDRVAVTGTVDLGNATLGLTVQPGFVPAPGTAFRLIDNDGSDPVGGTFHDIPEGATVARGSLRFVVSYAAGDGNDVTATRVREPPLISLSVSDAAPQEKTSVTLSATLGPQAPESAIPTGTVTFLDGASPIGTGTLSGGVATLSTAGLAPGPHQLTAVYDGDLTFAGTTSEARAVTVAAGRAPGSVAPLVNGLTQSHGRWRLGSALATLSAARVPRGTVFAFRLNEAASVRLSFTRRVAGRRVGGHCVAAGRRNRHAPRCSRSSAAGSVALSGHAGSDRVGFAGRLSPTRKLAPGTYGLAVTATSQGLTSTPSRLSFTAVR